MSDIITTCSICGGDNIGQLIVANANTLEESTVEIIELWDKFFCYDCETDVEVEEHLKN